MGIFDSIKESFQGHLDKKKEEKAMMDRLRMEAEAEKQRLFEEKFKVDAMEVAKAQAYKESAEKSGLQKLRATNRLRNLNQNNVAPGSWFEKLSEFTKKNIAKREENLSRTKEMRTTAEKIKQERDVHKINRNNPRTSGFGSSSWKM